MWWWCHHHIFSGISCFWGSKVHQKYAMWVLIGCIIELHIQQVLMFEIWVKPQGDKLKIQKMFFVSFPSKFIILFYYFNYYFIVFLRRPILDPKIPLLARKVWAHWFWRAKSIPRIWAKVQAGWMVLILSKITRAFYSCCLGVF